MLALARGLEACLRVLLGERPKTLPQGQEASARGMEDIARALRVQAKYWQSVRELAARLPPADLPAPRRRPARVDDSARKQAEAANNERDERCKRRQEKKDGTARRLVDQPDSASEAPPSPAARLPAVAAVAAPAAVVAPAAAPDSAVAAAPVGTVAGGEVAEASCGPGGDRSTQTSAPENITVSDNEAESRSPCR